jgi:hypothetical protein
LPETRVIGRRTGVGLEASRVGEASAIVGDLCQRAGGGQLAETSEADEDAGIGMLTPVMGRRRPLYLARGLDTPFFLGWERAGVHRCKGCRAPAAIGGWSPFEHLLLSEDIVSRTPRTGGTFTTSSTGSTAVTWRERSTDVPTTPGGVVPDS